MDASLSTNSVKFVDEYDAGRMLLGLLEQIAHTGGAYSHKHFYEIATADRKKRHFRLAGYRTRQQRFASSGRANQYHSFWDVRTQILVLLMVLEKINNLLHIELRSSTTAAFIKLNRHASIRATLHPSIST